jgi:putative ABC transport system substrate-binding protein
MLWSHVPATDPNAELYRQAFRDLGYEEGRNLTLKLLSAEGQLDRLPGLAIALVKQGVDLIITTNDITTRAAQRATNKIPIVMVGLGSDPVQLGFVENLRRPGGNITGTYSLISGLESKRLEMLHEAMPQVTRVGVLRHTPFGESSLPDLRRASETLKLKLEIIDIGSADELKTAFQTAKRNKVGAMLLMWSPVFYLNRDRIAALAVEYRIPIVSSLASEIGAFMSYGVDLNEHARRACSYADRLLRGAKPSDLPVEIVSTVRLTINLRTAEKMGSPFLNPS